MTVTEERTYSTREVSMLTGLTKRQLDYWMRCRVLGSLGLEMPGQGHNIVWHTECVPALRILQALNSLGAGHRVLRRVVNEIAFMRPFDFSPWLVVDIDGGISWATHTGLSDALQEAGRIARAVWVVNISIVVWSAGPNRISTEEGET